MIETQSALDCLDSILAVPGVDAIYVGPSDLSVGLGLGPGNNDGEPAFDKALDQIVDACHRHSVVAGIHADAALASRRLDQGFEMVTIAEDLSVLQMSVANILEQTRT
jgi:4-hydroxy-2-oxoheptanedioate aldolase